MKKGAAIVDVSVDQDCCIETCGLTTHSAPFYIEEGVVNCCITNLPGTVPLTSTHALSRAALLFGLELADKGIAKATAEKLRLQKGTIFSMALLPAGWLLKHSACPVNRYKNNREAAICFEFKVCRHLKL
jgi:alanine dehydrogenase